MSLELFALATVVLLELADLVRVEASAPVHALPRPSAAVRCPYCHQVYAEGEARVACPECATQHHAPCWADHGGCSLIGCTGRAPLGRPAPGQVDSCPAGDAGRA